MKVSVIVAVYNDLEALQLIVGAMRSQTYTNFEVVVAEDAQHESIRGYLDTINDIEIVHTTEDETVSFINAENPCEYTIIDLVDSTNHLPGSTSNNLRLALPQSTTMRHSLDVS